jgi:hypothetical protein
MSPTDIAVEMNREGSNILQTRVSGVKPKRLRFCFLLIFSTAAVGHRCPPSPTDLNSQNRIPARERKKDIHALAS